MHDYVGGWQENDPPIGALVVWSLDASVQYSLHPKKLVILGFKIYPKK